MSPCRAGLRPGPLLPVSARASVTVTGVTVIVGPAAAAAQGAIVGPRPVTAGPSTTVTLASCELDSG